MNSVESYLILIALCALPLLSNAQERPSYCDEIPVMYDKGAMAKPPALPRFETKPVTEYKVQVAILKFTHPKDYPFHKYLVARYRPCEQVWVVETKKCFRSRQEAEDMRSELKDLGYSGAYIVDVLAYE
ncbi:MAG: hypothetical protein NXI25_02110 [bacterium]|jgi:hypothetical protein|nr:hypothetical protein [bacterium]